MLFGAFAKPTDTTTHEPKPGSDFGNIPSPHIIRRDIGSLKKASNQEDKNIYNDYVEKPNNNVNNYVVNNDSIFSINNNTSSSHSNNINDSFINAFNNDSNNQTNHHHHHSYNSTSPSNIFNDLTNAFFNQTTNYTTTTTNNNNNSNNNFDFFTISSNNNNNNHNDGINILASSNNNYNDYSYKHENDLTFFLVLSSILVLFLIFTALCVCMRHLQSCRPIRERFESACPRCAERRTDGSYNYGFLHIPTTHPLHD